MSFFILLLLFFIGLAVGSFLNVLAVRYDPERPIFSGPSLLGRSHCPHCGKTLSAFELIPLVSFLWQRGRCRGCRHSISSQYFLVELFTGIYFVAVPLFLTSFYALTPKLALHGGPFVFAAGLWILVGLTLLLMSLIDLRLMLIPDQLTVFIGLVGLVQVFFLRRYGLFGSFDGSFLGSAAGIFAFRENIFWNHILAALVGGGVFGLVWALSRGRGMGFGDVKLAAALGFLFGWPDVLLILMLAVVIGAGFGLGLIFSRKKGFRDGIPFGPFLALGAMLVFFWGETIFTGYLKFFGL